MDGGGIGRAMVVVGPEFSKPSRNLYGNQTRSISVETKASITIYFAIF
jgi:hypothetical protein